MIRVHTALKSFVAFYVVAAVSYGCGVWARPDAATATRDTYQAALAACRAYDLAPSSVHTPETDQICAGLRSMCGVPLTIELTVSSGGAGGEGGAP